MMESAPSAFGAWTNFAMLIGTSAATLTGLVFVVITLVTRDSVSSSEGIKTFTTPTVLHFSTALFVSALIVVPWQVVIGPAIMIGLAGCYGVVHLIRAWLVSRHLNTYQPDLEDKISYTILPIVAYCVLIAGAAFLVPAPRGAMFGLAAGLVLLTFLGIRNAWDLVTFIVGKQIDAPK